MQVLCNTWVPNRVPQTWQDRPNISMPSSPSIHFSILLPPSISLTVPSPFHFPGVFCFSELSFITEPSDVVVITRDPVTLDCVAHGQPPITIRWLRNGVRVEESERLQILSNGSLYIPEVRRDGEESDKGFYQCLSQNRYGAILSQRSRLTITSKYGAWGKYNVSLESTHCIYLLTGISNTSLQVVCRML